jgi:hypothetical protein
MYTNIATDHTLQVIITHFEDHEAPSFDFFTEALMAALKIIMGNGNPACTYVRNPVLRNKRTLRVFKDSIKYLKFYKRYLEDIFDPAGNSGPHPFYQG